MNGTVRVCQFNDIECTRCGDGTCQAEERARNTLRAALGMTAPASPAPAKARVVVDGYRYAECSVCQATIMLRDPAPAKESATQVPVSASLGSDVEPASGNRPASPERKLAGTNAAVPHSVFADPEQPSAALALVVSTAPKRIWLQVSDYVEDRDAKFPEPSLDLTWCAESVTACEVEYVRADLASLRSVEPAPRGEQESLLRDPVVVAPDKPRAGPPNKPMSLGAYERAQAEQWCNGLAECIACGHKWIAVWHLNAVQLECPKCHSTDTTRERE